MKKYTAAALVTLALVLAPIVVTVEWKPTTAAVLPWTTFSESTADTLSASPGQCRQGVIMVVTLEKAGAAYMYFYAPDTGRVVFATFSPEGRPAEIGVGTVAPNAHDNIPPLAWTKFDGEGRHAGGPCALLYPDQA